MRTGHSPPGLPAVAIREAVVPAFARLLTFFREEYVPQARTTLAAEAMPDGQAWYREQIRKYTTLDLSADEIQSIYYAARQYVKLKSHYLSPMRSHVASPSVPAEYDRRAAAAV